MCLLLIGCLGHYLRSLENRLLVRQTSIRITTIEPKYFQARQKAGNLSINMTPDTTITTLLKDWRAGDGDAMERLAPLIYQDLHELAARRMRFERPDHTLQATALVNEAFSRLADANLSFQDRAHFYAIAARTMRRILTDYGRQRHSLKRGGGLANLTLDEDQLAASHPSPIVDLDEALEKLAGVDQRKSDLLVLQFFGGMTYDEMAEALDVSAATVHRDLRLAKAWLANELADV